jgi:N-acetylneuraminic acid mutarotase
MITTIKRIKLLSVTALCAATALVTACGGGGGGNQPPVTTYAVSATAGSGGSISPASATVNAGGATTFTVTPNSGYAITSVVGCGGSLSGKTYTTGATNANCAVMASFSAAFTWVSGSNTADANGIYGTQGVAASSNVPGARTGPISWTDAAGNLWAYGGYGVGDPILNDMWTYSPANGGWTWVGGSSTPNATAVYGTLGVAATANTPGANGGAAYSWTDANGNMWMFGGYGYDSTGTRGWLNALWEYSATSGIWTWWGGSTTVNAPGVYGTKGVAAATNYPGARAGGGFKDASGNVWLFGGAGYDSTGTLGSLNDLWEYSPSSRQWTWVSGSNTVNAMGVFGTQGVAAATNVPGAGSGSAWMDASGNLWVFGGTGYDSTGARGELNALWEYSPSTHMWTWVGGSNTVNARGVYGTQGVAAATNMPGARHYTTTWTDAAGNFWLFGGVGFDSTGAFNELNDLWKYSPSSNQWTWVGGSNMVNAPGVYGTQGVAAAANIPGARDDLWVWNDGSNVWLFGGEGLNPSGADPNAPKWNDLWKYPIK